MVGVMRHDTLRYLDPLEALGSKAFWGSEKCITRVIHMTYLFCNTTSVSKQMNLRY
jgi:hypothetical protein